MPTGTLTPVLDVGAVLRARHRRSALVFGSATVLLAVVAALSLLIGVRDLDPATVWQALTAPIADDVDHMVVLQQRVPAR
ncbi:hypothetical protein [Tessaracoccus coleopterorum]|uniref:hypothetical protein n=1 Tax=Tessaracoccus coleopterorum TaxID=2714950 RepID=UPI0018D3CBF1|nr:hypothetical protein [Tessaracoccus coleopterorum]